MSPSRRPRAARVPALALLFALSLVGPTYAQTAAETLHQLLDDHWEFGLKSNPLGATAMGRHEYDHLMPDSSRPALEAGDQATRQFLERLAPIDRDALAEQDRVSYDVFRWLLQSQVEDFEAGGWKLFLTADWGFHVGLVTLGRDMPLADVDGYEDYMARLEAFPRYFGEQIALLRAGVESGWTLPKVVLEGYDDTIRAQVVDVIHDSVFWQPFESFPSGVPKAEQDGLRAAGEQAVAAANSAYASFLDFMTGEYMPGARESLGASQMPGGGGDYYEARVRYYTTLPDLTATEIHQKGLEEVARIREEMDAIVAQVRGEGLWGGPDAGEDEFEAFLEFLRTDAAFYAATPEELLKQASYLAKKMDGKLPHSSGATAPAVRRRARARLDLAPKFTGGRYVPAPIGTPLRRHLLGEHLRSRQPPALRAGGADAARGGARTPSPGRAGPGTGGSAALPPAAPTSRPSAKAGGSTRSASVSKRASMKIRSAISVA